MIPIIKRAENNKNNKAIISSGETYDYGDLIQSSRVVAERLLRDNKDLKSARVAYMVTPGFEYVAVQWGIWRAGGIAVPLCLNYPLPSLKYVIEDAEASYLIASPNFVQLLTNYAEEKKIQLIPTNFLKSKENTLPNVVPERAAMILYTSGTTGSPKGVVTTHAQITAQIKTLTDAWKWSQNDHILNVLPLHHVHGIVNVVSCAMWSGATCEFLPGFETSSVFEAFNRGEINLFMAVPTIYHKLIAYWKALPITKREEISNVLKRFRLMVSGSAALPVSVMEKWEEISGHRLLERYGMTEIGMAISNPYRGDRIPGHIGQPLPNVRIRLVKEGGTETNNGPGEIQVKGPGVFKEYWKRPEATRKSFTKDGWFKTGDIAELDKGSYRILGRESVDIIKSGGYKISALEIEETLRKHDKIIDCAVVGIPDQEWGEIIAAGLVSENKDLAFDKLSHWMKDFLPGYKIPKKYLLLEELPKNAMGKVTKNDLKELFQK